jgi:Tol biopolymer transport system component
MELLDGETVRDAVDRAQPAPLTVRRTVEYGIQIAEALSVAHEKGILHRDLKPENLFITADKRVKILDFGLAKLAEAKDTDGRQRTGRHLTSAGIVVGTPGYMSPEQVRAHALDARTDIFSLGTVLYEMLTGQSPFERDSAIETMHAVLSVDPPAPSTLNAEVPPSLEAIVRHCMEKDPRERFQSARDLAFQLRMLADVPSTATNTRRVALAPRRRVPWRALAIFLGALALLGAGGLAVAKFGGAAAGSATGRRFVQLTFADGVELFPTLAQDGKTIAYVSSQSGNRDIYIQRVDGRAAINITVDSPDDDSEPAFSRDGSQIAFRSERDGGGIFVMGVTGESVRRLTDFGHNPSWSPDGTRLVVSTVPTEMRPHIHNKLGALWIIDARTGGARRQLLSDKLADAKQPSWSPNGHRILYWGLTGDHRDLWSIAPDAKDPFASVTRVTADAALDWNPIWSSDGEEILFGSDRDGTLNLWRMAIDEESGEPGGAPEPVSLPAPVTGNFTLSQPGSVAFTTAIRTSRLIAIPFDSATALTGEPRAMFGGSQEIFSFEVSPDGKSVAYTTSGGTQEDVFVANADGTKVRQLTNDAARDRSVTWSPDSKTLYFHSTRDGASEIWSIRADGSRVAPVTDKRDLQRVRSPQGLSTPQVSRDGRRLTALGSNGAVLIHLDRPIGQRVEPLSEQLLEARWSPDGTRVAGRLRAQHGEGIAICTIATKHVDKLTGSGVSPQWLPDSRHVAIFDGGEMLVVDIGTRKVTKTSFKAPPGVRIGAGVSAPPRLSPDGTTLYVRQTLEEGDIWLAHFEQR